MCECAPFAVKPGTFALRSRMDLYPHVIANVHMDSGGKVIRHHYPCEDEPLCS